MAAPDTQRINWRQHLFATGGRVRQLIIFGFEQIVLSRLFERHRLIAQSVTAALLKARTRVATCGKPHI